MFLAAARGIFPPVDGGVTFLPSLPDGNRAVVAFTGHAVVASPWTADQLRWLEPDGFGGAMDPRVLIEVARADEDVAATSDDRSRLGAIGVHDVTMVATGIPHGVDDPLEPTDRFDEHPRVVHARHLRRNVTVLAGDAGFVTLAEGLAGRPEISVELLEPGVRPGDGRDLIGRARQHVPAGSPLFAAVSPGNARSLRAFLAAGFVPIGSEVIVDMAGSKARDAS